MCILFHHSIFASNFFVCHLTFISRSYDVYLLPHHFSALLEMEPQILKYSGNTGEEGRYVWSETGGGVRAPTSWRRSLWTVFFYQSKLIVIRYPVLFSYIVHRPAFITTNLRCFFSLVCSGEESRKCFLPHFPSPFAGLVLIYINLT